MSREKSLTVHLSRLLVLIGHHVNTLLSAKKDFDGNCKRMSHTSSVPYFFSKRGVCLFKFCTIYSVIVCYFVIFVLFIFVCSKTLSILYIFFFFKFWTISVIYHILFFVYYLYYCLLVLTYYVIFSCCPSCALRCNPFTTSVCY